MQRTSRYHTTEILGEGGNAKVYRAWDSLQKREVALKVLKSSSAADETSRLSFSGRPTSWPAWTIPVYRRSTTTASMRAGSPIWPCKLC